MKPSRIQVGIMNTGISRERYVTLIVTDGENGNRPVVVHMENQFAVDLGTEILNAATALMHPKDGGIK